MNKSKIIVAAALWLVVAGLGFWLYKIIQDPVQFEADYNKRFKKTTERMEDVRIAQGYYLKANGEYAGSFDDLIKSIKNDLITEVIIKGNPDDTTIVTTYDTVKYYIKDDIELLATANLDSIRRIPFTGEEFDLQAAILKLQRVEVPVYELIAPKQKYLKGLKQEYWGLKEDLVMGSVYEATDKGNWE